MSQHQNPVWDDLVSKRISQHFRQFHTTDTATLRRSFLRSMAGFGLASGFFTPGRTQASPRPDDDGNDKVATALPNPIPGGASPLGIMVHHFPVPPTGTPLSGLNDPSEITDFNGFIGDTRLRGAGSGTGFPQLAFQTDMGFMQGEYIGQDGRHHHGTFCFI
jgi:hypothetical protein